MFRPTVKPLHREVEGGWGRGGGGDGEGRGWGGGGGVGGGESGGGRGGGDGLTRFMRAAVSIPAVAFASVLHSAAFGGPVVGVVRPL